MNEQAEDYETIVVLDHPEVRSMVTPRGYATDARLSARAKGVMLTVLAMDRGFKVTAAAITEHCKEGRDAVRTALRELEACGYLEHRRRQSEDGRWATTTLLYPYGPPRTAFQASENQASENQALSSNSYIGTTSKEVAAADHIVVSPLGPDQNLDGQQPLMEDSPTPPVTDRNQGIPWTEVHLLRDWFKVERPEQVEAWQQAWRTGCAVVGAEYDPQVHLVTYLTRCHEEKRDPRPGLWLKFLIEDRQRYLLEQKALGDRLEQQASADGGESWALASLKNTPRWGRDEDA